MRAATTRWGLWRLRRGEFAEAERHFRAAIARLTRRNPNPIDGEPLLQSRPGAAVRGQETTKPTTRLRKLRGMLRGAGLRYHALAEIDASRGACGSRRLIMSELTLACER